VPLWPSLGALGLIAARTKEWMVGRRSRGVELTEGLLEHLAAPESAGIDEIQHSRIRLVLLYSLGLFEASMGSGKTEQYAQVLEGDREHRVSAWRVRVLMHLNQGNAEEARKCLRRAELLQLQDGGEQRYLGTSSGLELIAYAQAGDLLGVKSAVEAVAVLAERCEGWQPLLRYGLCYQLWLRGDLEGAIAMLLPAFEIARPGRHPYFSIVAAAHVALLGALGRDDEALSLGESYAETCRCERLTPDDRFVYVELAQVLARKGEHRRALDMIDAVVAEGQRLRMAGLSLGLLYEARARIAICMRDRPLFERSAELCAIEYKKGRNPVLGQKLARLMEEARKNRAAPSEPPPQVKLLLAVTQQHETEHDTINSRILECVDGSDRARCALTMLLQSTESCVGYLYGAWEGRVEVLAALPDVPAEEGLGSWVQECIQAEIDAGAGATLTADADAEADHSEHEVASRYIDQEGRYFQSVLLVAMHQQQLSIAGVLALQIVAAPRSLPKKELLEEIGAVLLEQGDVGGVAMLDAGATVEDRQ
jgi:tetratricopeptide (TPR) repeat protein